MKRTGMFLLIVFLGMQPALAAWAKKIMVVQSRSLALYNQTWDGFIKSTKAEVERVNLEGDLVKGKTIIQSISPDSQDLVVTIGTEATMLAKKYLGPIPVVFSMILEDPKIEGRINSGVLMNIKVEKQFKYISELFPNRKKMGVIYNVKYTDSSINEARQMAEYYKFTLYTMAIETNADVAMAVQKCTNDRVDIIWSILDPIMIRTENVSLLINQALKEKIPFIGLSEAHVKAGALVAMSVNFEKLGEQTSKLANNLLKEGVSLPVQNPDKVILYINSKTEKETGITIPKVADLEMNRL